MADKKVARIVVHPKLNLSVGGKLQRMKVGAEIMLTPEAAKRLDELGRTRDPKKAPAVEVDDGNGSAKELTKAEQKARAKAEADLDKRQKALDKARDKAGLDKRQEALDAARSTPNLSNEQTAALDETQNAIDTERLQLDDAQKAIDTDRAALDE